MAFYEKLTKGVKKSTEFLREQVQQLELLSRNADDFFAKIERDLEQCRKTGIIPTYNGETPTSEDRTVQVKNEALSPVKPTRRVLKENQIINSNSKSQETNASVKVKQEKLSNVSPQQRESINDMPPPQSLPLKKHIKTEKRSTRARTKKQKQKENKSESEEEERGNSDVIIQNTTITTIDLCSDEEQPREVRSTRTRTRNAAKKAESSTESTKRSRSASEESNKSKTPQKSSKKKKALNPEESVYEDALSDNVKETKTRVMNETFCKGTSNIMTDDDSPVQSKTVKGKNAKPLFSVFDHSPVKKKVEAFEKLEAIANAANTPVRQTRTKTRAQAKEKNECEESTTILPNKGAIPKLKTKLQTPLLPNSTSKITKSSIPSPVPRALSAIKSSAAEFRERELKRQKEVEARQKREALLQAQIEEKRRKREEKQIKAQQMREEIENKKRKHLETAEKSKEEKLKQQMAEREAKLMKQKEELEKKRQIAKQKAIGEKMKAQEVETPIYMIKKAPLLPTPDCYDSDTEEGQDRQFTLPEWTKGKQLSNNLKVMHAIGEQMKNSFFCRTAQTIDLEKVFPGIDIRKLKRTSSAMWTRPPRFTLMPQFINSLNVTEETDESNSDNEP